MLKRIGFLRNGIRKVLPDSYQLVGCHSRHFSHELSNDWPIEIKRTLERDQIINPTPIQEKVIPLMLEKKDLIGIARTGSGKTLAFVLPIVVKLLQQRSNINTSGFTDSEDIPPKSSTYLNSQSPFCLVLAPTRELATQICSVFNRFSSVISTIELVGGKSRSEQLRLLSRRNFDVYVATPGRLIDLIQSKVVNLSHTRNLVIDEADRLLDMGFEEDIRYIKGCLHSERQVTMFSATWPKEVARLTQELSNNIEYLEVDSPENKANPNITQETQVCAPHEKMEKIVEYIKSVQENEKEFRMLIFCNTKRTVDFVTMQLARNRYRVVSIHSNLSQNQRTRSLQLFSSNDCNILVATDVASRGLDIKNITHVINFDLPLNMEDYIHRIGRTARHDKAGISHSFVTENDSRILRQYIDQLKSVNAEIPEELNQLNLSASSYKDINTRYQKPRKRNYGSRNYGIQQGYNVGRRMQY